MRTLIALYTAFLIYVDDIFQYHADAVHDFNELFVLPKPRGDFVLDFFAQLQLELPRLSQSGLLHYDHLNVEPDHWASIGICDEGTCKCVSLLLFGICLN